MSRCTTRCALARLGCVLLTLPIAAAAPSEACATTVAIRRVATEGAIPGAAVASLALQAVQDTARDTTAQRPARPQVLESLQVVAKAPSRRSYNVPLTSTATKTPTPLRDVPQAVTVVSHELITDQGMQSMADVVRYVPGITMGQGEGNRDQPTIRGNGTTASFFVNGVRDDVQYFRDLYNVDRVEALKGANALIFGRGVGGGVINRVTKDAQWTSTREMTIQGGSYGNKRGAIDIGQGVSGQIAARLNAMYENSDMFRRGVNVERYGINPAVTFLAGPRTKITANYERFSDHRTADRGIPSFAGTPSDADPRTFFGDTASSYADASINTGTAAIEHELNSALLLRNRSVVGHYDKFYQNIFPGAVNATETEVSLSAYNNRTARLNLFNQTELVYRAGTGPVAHTIMGGVEVGRQVTDNFRNTGYFDGTATSIAVPFASPTVSRPVAFRQSATDADNHTVSTTVSAYAQDQIALSPHLQLIGGVRYERFETRYHNNRTAQDLARTDHLLSPRAGAVVKPVEMLSFYASYGVSYLPSSGDQFSSLTVTTATLEPEKFTNYELGTKLDVGTGLSLSAAVFRLDRTNTTAPDPTDPSRTVQTGSQRTNGFELGATGNVTRQWQVAAGYANQDAYITSQTSAAAPGAKVALVPRNTLSLWNKYQLVPRLGLGLGVIYQDKMFAAVDNTVTLPSFTRFDAAAFVTVSEYLRVQVNLENLLDTRYYITSNSNNNISPGSPRAVRVALMAGL